MTDFLDVSDETPRRSYTATSGQTVFAVPFIFFEDDDLQVFVNDVLQASSAYVVTGALDPDGGQIEFDTGLVLNDNVLISRVLPIELTTHIPTGGGRLDIASVNLQFSKLVALLQQQSVERSRSLRQPDSDTDDFDDLPAAADRALGWLGFGAAGQPIIGSAVDVGAVASAYMLTLLVAANAAAARVTLGITDQSSYVGLANWQACR